MTERVERLTMTVEEAAQALGISRKAVYNLIHQEGFPVLWIGRCARVNGRAAPVGGRPDSASPDGAGGGAMSGAGQIAAGGGAPV